MTESAFMVMPIAQPRSLEAGPGAEATAPASDAAPPLHDLELQIRARLGVGPSASGIEVEFMEGIDAWTVRLPGVQSAESLRSRLAGLPVEVADDQPFFAI